MVKYSQLDMVTCVTLPPKKTLKIKPKDSKRISKIGICLPKIL